MCAAKIFRAVEKNANFIHKGIPIYVARRYVCCIVQTSYYSDAFVYIKAQVTTEIGEEEK